VEVDDLKRQLHRQLSDHVVKVALLLALIQLVKLAGQQQLAMRQAHKLAQLRSLAQDVRRKAVVQFNAQWVRDQVQLDPCRVRRWVGVICQLQLLLAHYCSQLSLALCC
jgi:hypothetical protein